MLAAWTQGRGVVASDLDYFREALPADSDAGTLFQAGSADALAQALRVYLSIPAEQRHRAAMAMAEEAAWDRCILPVAEALRA